MADGIQIEADGARRKLESIDINNLQKRKDLKKIIGVVLRKARSQVSKDAKLNLSSDPRQAYKAVRNSVYKKILGGQVNILPSRKASSARASIERHRIVGEDPHHWGGNRRKRSARTEQIDSYWGKDRGFILRFVNAGTSARSTRYGGRGQIGARNWFGLSSTAAMQSASEELSNLIDQAIQQVWTEG